METTELLKKVRKIEIKTRGLSNQIFSGEYHSAFKGRGMAFSEVREYMPGDDIRSIDWNVTARFNHPFVKVFEEERELTVMLLVDISSSGEFGTAMQFKKDMITELCAVLSFSAIQNNDKIGVIFFTDKIEKFIPPKKGKTHALRIIRELLEFEPENKKTSIGDALRYFTNVIKKRSIAFIISDFMDSSPKPVKKEATSFRKNSGYEDALKIASRKHDVVGIKIMDMRESEMPDVGLIRLRDAETNKMKLIDTSNPSVRNNFKKAWLEKEKSLQDILTRSGVQVVNLKTNQNYVKPLMSFFKQRGKK